MLSGGMDSVALLYLLYEYLQEEEFVLEVIHFNYGLRGQESEDDESFVKALCDQLKLKYYIVKASLKRQSGIQDQARKIRYEKIREMQLDASWDYVFSAHHIQDQVETIIMRMNRGAGMRGLKGIPSDRKLCDGLILYRPFLKISKIQIKKYIEFHKIKYREDSSNQSNKYFRNRIRKEYKDLLENIESIDDHPFQKMIDILNIEEKQSLLECEKYFQTYPVDDKNGLKLPQNKYSNWNQQVRFLFLEHVFKKLGLKEQFTQKNFYLCEEFIKSSKPKFHYFGNIEFFSGYGWIFIHPIYEFNNFRNSSTLLQPEGDTLLIGLNKKVSIESVQIDQSQLKSKALSSPIFSFSDLSRTLYFSKRPQEKMIVRYFRPGDLFCPFGRSSNLKLKDYFIERKIIKSLRPYIPLVEIDGNIEMIAGVEISSKRAMKGRGFSLKISDI